MQHPFEKVLSINEEEIEFALQGMPHLEWLEYWLNPRRLRGSDFLMRWSQGVWSEQRLRDAVNATQRFFAIPYGPSGTAPTDDVRAFELYFERLENAGLGNIKRPDLLIFPHSKRKSVEQFLDSIGGSSELPFIPETDLQTLISQAIVAIECENSLWIAEKMPAFGQAMKPQKRLHGKLGFSKTAVLPTIIIKEEDRKPLLNWQAAQQKPIHVWHVFFDRAFGLALDEAERLIHEGLILPTEQVFQSPGGATTKKAIYKHYYHYAYLLGVAENFPTLVPEFIQDKNGHILPFVRFEGGSLSLNESTIARLEGLQ